MDNSNYTQQYPQNINNPPAQPVAPTDGGNKLPLIISIALGAIVFVETIVLFFTITNLFTYINDDYTYEEEAYVDEEDNSGFRYDDNDNLVAFDAVCRNDGGSYYDFGVDGKYQFYSSASSPADSGTYTMAEDSIVSLNGSQSKTVYYTGEYIADGANIYECEEETTTEE